MVTASLKRYSVFVLLMASLSASAQRRTLQQSFVTPPDSVKPSVYYYWLSDNISRTGVQKDIEAMARIGIGRAFIGNIGLGKEETPYGATKLFTDEWWKITEQALQTAGKEKVDIGMFNSPGWSQSGGPWIKPAESMRYLYSQEWVVAGGQRLQQKLSIDRPDFQPVAVLAFPLPANDADVVALHKPALTASPLMNNIAYAADNDTATTVMFPEKLNDSTVITIDISLQQDFSARSLVLCMSRHAISTTVTLQAATNGNYQTIKEFLVDRSNPAENVGFTPFAPVAIAFNETTARQFRLLFSHVQGNGGVAEIQLTAAPRVERYEEKQLAKMFQTPLPLWNEYQWPSQDETSEKKWYVDPTSVIDVTKYLGQDEMLNWQAPAGNWVISRYGMLPTGVTNAPATPEGRGLEADKMNKEVMTAHFNAFIGNVQKRIPPANRKALKFVVADSYETGSQNWTDGMTEGFKKQFGYDPLPWLPVLKGHIIGSADQSNRFLWDLRRRVADKVAYDYVGGLRDISHKNGLKLWLENYGHWGFPSEFLKYGGQSDEIGGEFWNEGSLGNIECRAASSAAHIYGKTKVSAESFTAGGQAYVRYPALLKRRGDWSFTEGINNTLLHVFIHQPYEERSPGVNAWFGTEFNRKNTWFTQGKAFIDYIRRCNYLLQQGKPVDDVAYFIGEDAPKMTGIRNPELPAGYQFDYINAEVIENRLSVKNGRLVLPDGMSFRVLVLPPVQTMRPALLKKIQQLVADGAVVMGPAPVQSPSLQNYPAADAEVKKIASPLWANADGKRASSHSFGKGVVYNGLSMEQLFGELKWSPDFLASTHVQVLYTHRTTDTAEIYFVSNQADSAIAFDASFRSMGKPEYWDAVTGEVRNLPVFTQNGNTTTLPLVLQNFQSAFIVFKKTKQVSSKETKSENFPSPVHFLIVDKPWTVQFDTSMRGPLKPVVFDSLTDWSQSNDPLIKNYSGTAVYTTSFNITSIPAGEQLYLNLGKLTAMASVTLNGKKLGTVWTAPWQVNATTALKLGNNQVQIEVVNTWVNRLIGDSQLPEAERRTWTNANPYTPKSEYQAAGLLGPVIIQRVRY